MTANPTFSTPDAKPRTAHVVRPTAGRYRTNTIFRIIAILATVMAITILLILLLSILLKGLGRLNADFITSMASYQPQEAGVYAAIIGTIVVCAICALSALPLGVGTAVLIEEFKPKGAGVSSRNFLLALLAVFLTAFIMFQIGGVAHAIAGTVGLFLIALIGLVVCYAVFHLIITRVGKGSPAVVLHSFIEVNIRNLAGVPSIVYGILGVTAFAAMFGIFGIAGQSNIALGQKWYDQYSDAQGNLLFVPVETYRTPPTPLYINPVTEPQRFEVWRGTDPVLVGSQTDVDAAAAEEASLAPADEGETTPPVEEDAEATPDTDKVEKRLDALATLEIADDRWIIKPNAATAEEVDFQQLGIEPGDIVRFGFLFDEFSQREVYSRFVVTQVEPDAISVYGSKIDSFLVAAEPGADRVEREVMGRETFGPMVSQIEKEIEAFEDSMQDGINKSRDGSRNTGPARIDQATAEQIVDKAIAAGPFTGDTSKLRENLIQQLLKLDGKESRDLRASRRELVNAAVDAEKEARLSGKILSGQNPNRVDFKSWYYVSLPFGRGVLAGGLTLMLVVLPIVIVASQEALRGVPSSHRQGALALGATKWQAVSKTALPAAIPGICTGTILALSRAIGEAAPILILGGVVFINFTPANVMDKFTVLPLQIYNWSSQPSDSFRELAAAGIIVLLVILLSFNAVAIYIRQRASRHN